MDSYSYVVSAPSVMFRRLSAVIWFTALAALILLFWMPRLNFDLPRIQHIEIFNKGKWSAMESKLHPIESELNKYHDVFSEIKFTVKPPVKHFALRKRAKDIPNKVHKPVVRKHSMPILFNISSCLIQKQSIPKTDIQMLSVYDRLRFDDIDGGVWKQGWNIEYNSDQWNQKNKLKVIIVPHSHHDPGWIENFETTYERRTRGLFDNMMKKLSEGMSNRKFIWAEIAFLAIWWESDASNEDKTKFINYLKNKKIEIVTGGWVMNDEANSHWLSTIQQLTVGHQWCLHTLGITPKNAWSIDPFGYSSSQPYLLKLAGLENSVIHRVHYILKKELASKRQLEIKWRQLWDGVGKTDMFTHIFPFFSYDVPHSCGPDPAVCCQFDFIRLNGSDVSCPWGIAAQNITKDNVHERATLLLDQWRKKAQLYRSNVLLVPLGDDSMFNSFKQWNYQFQNYDVLINYINNNDALNTEVQFGNLEDYFNALHADVNMTDFPVLSGDFFTYADRQQHYWSGYYTSRPFYKNMERVLLAYFRAAETISSQAMSSRLLSRLMTLQLLSKVENARRALSLFQHHDAITGTSRSEVVEDNGKKMVIAIKDCQAAIQQATHYLLKQPSIVEKTQDVIYFDESWRRHDELPARITIILDAVTPAKKIALYNALPFTRHEILTVFVTSPHVEIFDSTSSPITAQVSPVVLGNKTLAFADFKYQVSFPVMVKSLALTMYTVALRSHGHVNKYTFYSHIRGYNANQWTMDLPKEFPVEQLSARLTEDITIQSGNSSKIITNANGLIKAIVSPDGTVVPVNMDFAQYDSQYGKDKNSGAYLFHPTGPAEQFHPESFPEIIVIEGIYKATLYTALNSPKIANVVVEISVYNDLYLQQSEVEISNTLLIDPHVYNLELAMRFSTDIKNGDVFYTDSNGMQMIRRRHFAKLPIQANYYPMPAAAYIQDDRIRLTLLTSTPLGVAALQSGQIEVMQDRRLSQDDVRGLEQGVLDNVRTRHTFKLIIENAIKPCPLNTPTEHPSGQLTLGAHVSQQLLLQPLIVMHYTALDYTGHDTFSRVTLNAADLVLASYQSHVTTKDKEGTLVHGMGVTFQRVYLDPCYGNKEISKWYHCNDGQIQMSELVDTPDDSVYETSLTFTTLKTQLPDGIVSLCPQEVRSVFINKTFKTLEVHFSI